MSEFQLKFAHNDSVFIFFATKGSNNPVNCQSWVKTKFGDYMISQEIAGSLRKSVSKKIITAIISPAFIIGASVGHNSSKQIQRVIDFVNVYKTPPAENFFSDYNYVDIVYKRDADSKIETYIRHKPSDSYVPITKNFFRENRVNR